MSHSIGFGLKLISGSIKYFNFQQSYHKLKLKINLNLNLKTERL